MRVQFLLGAPMLKAFLNVRTVRSAQLVEKGFLIGGREPDYLKNLLSRTSYFLQVLVGNGLYTYRYWSVQKLWQVAMGWSPKIRSSFLTWRQGHDVFAGEPVSYAIVCSKKGQQLHKSVFLCNCCPEKWWTIAYDPFSKPCIKACMPQFDRKWPKIA